MDNTSSTLVITGGGLVGMAAALLFHDRFDRVQVCEKRSNPLTDENVLQPVTATGHFGAARMENHLNLLGVSRQGENANTATERPLQT
jgi:thioredoxin reductase